NGNDPSMPHFPNMGNDPSMPRFPNMGNDPSVPGVPKPPVNGNDPSVPGVPKPPVSGNDPSVPGTSPTPVNGNDPSVSSTAGSIALMPEAVCGPPLQNGQSTLKTTTKVVAVLFKSKNFVAETPQVVQVWDSDADSSA